MNARVKAMNRPSELRSADVAGGDVADRRCRCHLPLAPPDGPHWWPQRDPEPGERVLAVALYGQDAGFLRLVRLRGRWYRRGSGANHPDATGPVPWANAGRCWDGAHHAVVDATGLVPSGEQRPRVVVVGDAAIRQPDSPARSPLTGSQPPLDGAAAARRGSDG